MPSGADTILDEEAIAMHQYETENGTPVLEMNRAEYADYLDRQIEASVGMSAAEFSDRAASGDIDWDNPDAFYAAGLLGLGQNGHSRAA